MSGKEVLQFVKKGVKYVVSISQPVKPALTTQSLNIGFFGRMFVNARHGTSRRHCSQSPNTRRRDDGRVHASEMLQVLPNAQAHTHVKVTRDIINGLFLCNKLLDAVSLILAQLLEILLVGEVIVGLSKDTEEALVEFGRRDGDLRVDGVLQEGPETGQFLVDVFILGESIGDNVETLGGSVVPAGRVVWCVVCHVFYP